MLCNICKRSQFKTLEELESNHNWKITNCETKAHVLVAHAIQAGLLKRSSKCSHCNNSGKIHSHHRDYTKPLEVIWCCSKCHRQEHSCTYALLNKPRIQKRLLLTKLGLG